jgi:hypothetical protein
MSRVSPRMQTLARRLIAREAMETLAANKGSRHKSSGKPPQGGPRTDLPVVEKLRPKLATLMGQSGFHALLSRARALACAEAPRLQDVRINPDGSVEGWDELAAHLSPKGLSEAKAALLAQLLGLLQAFIGETLTRQLVLEVWPRLSLDNLDSGRGDHSEKK